MIDNRQREGERETGVIGKLGRGTAEGQEQDIEEWQKVNEKEGGGGIVRLFRVGYIGIYISCISFLNR